MKLLCDQMLGTLAKWLRIYGFDTIYANSEIDDEGLIEIAKKEKRVLITRDKDLIIKAKKELIKTIQVEKTGIDNELSVVLNEIGVDKSKILSRCTICNIVLDEIKKSEAKNKVAEKVFENNEKFWFCSKCKRIYWKGTHCENMIAKMDELKNQ
jgi:uncharacterized protein with PIN domain